VSGPLEVRAATAADASAIARIHAEGIEDRVATFETRPPAVAAVSALLESGALVLVAERGGEVIGFAKVAPYCDLAPYYDGIGEATTYVAREARSGGVGPALLSALAAEAERRGLYKLVGKIFSSNRLSLGLVTSLGWREVGVHRRHGRLEGEWKDVVVVELELGSARD
jgi:L-amino acid N-acyltransferase YncA